MTHSNEPTWDVTRPLHPSPWKPVDEHTPRNRWILLRGGTTDEDFYEDDPLLKQQSKTRSVTAHWHNGEWAIGYWDGSWFNTYNDPTEWMEIPA